MWYGGSVPHNYMQFTLLDELPPGARITVVLDAGAFTTTFATDSEILPVVREPGTSTFFISTDFRTGSHLPEVPVGGMRALIELVSSDGSSVPLLEHRWQVVDPHRIGAGVPSHVHYMVDDPAIVSVDGDTYYVYKMNGTRFGLGYVVSEAGEIPSAEIAERAVEAAGIVALLNRGNVESLRKMAESYTRVIELFNTGVIFRTIRDLAARGIGIASGAVISGSATINPYFLGKQFLSFAVSEAIDTRLVSMVSCAAVISEARDRMEEVVDEAERLGIGAPTSGGLLLQQAISHGQARELLDKMMDSLSNASAALSGLLDVWEEDQSLIAQAESVTKQAISGFAGSLGEFVDSGEWLSRLTDVSLQGNFTAMVSLVEGKRFIDAVEKLDLLFTGLDLANAELEVLDGAVRDDLRATLGRIAEGDLSEVPRNVSDEVVSVWASLGDYFNGNQSWSELFFDVLMDGEYTESEYVQEIRTEVYEPITTGQSGRYANNFLQDILEHGSRCRELENFSLPIPIDPQVCYLEDSGEFELHWRTTPSADYGCESLQYVGFVVKWASEEDLAESSWDEIRNVVTVVPRVWHDERLVGVRIDWLDPSEELYFAIRAYTEGGTMSSLVFPQATACP